MTNLELEKRVADLETSVSSMGQVLETQCKINDLLSDTMHDLMGKMLDISKNYNIKFNWNSHAFSKKNEKEP